MLTAGPPGVRASGFWHRACNVAERMANQKRATPTRDIVTLADLAPNRDVRGGRGRQVFGPTAVDAVRNVHQEDNMAVSKKTKDLAPKKNPKGGAKKRG